MKPLDPTLFLSFKMTSIIKIDQGIQILQMKKSQKFLSFSLLFSECFHLYLRKPTAAKSPLSMYCITIVIFVNILALWCGRFSE